MMVFQNLLGTNFTDQFSWIISSIIDSIYVKFVSQFHTAAYTEMVWYKIVYLSS
jgi:hypothetical protein